MNLSNFFMFIVKLLAGTGVFLVGVHLLTSNIEQLATGKIKDLFSKTAKKKDRKRRNRRRINRSYSKLRRYDRAYRRLC